MTSAILGYRFEDDGIELYAELQIDFDDDGFGDIEIIRYRLSISERRVHCTLTDEYLTARVKRWIKEQEEAYV